MRKILSCIVYFPALLFWVPFAISFRLAGNLMQEPKYMVWNWFGVQGINDDCYDLQAEVEFG